MYPPIVSCKYTKSSNCCTQYSHYSTIPTEGADQRCHEGKQYRPSETPNEENWVTNPLSRQTQDVQMFKKTVKNLLTGGHPQDPFKYSWICTLLYLNKLLQITGKQVIATNTLPHHKPEQQEKISGYPNHLLNNTGDNGQVIATTHFHKPGQ